MVSPSIIKAYQEIADIWKSMGPFHAYDADVHPDWVIEDVDHYILLEVEKAHINCEHIPSKLEKRLKDALFDCIVSENIEAEIEARDLEATYRSLMPGRI